MLKEAMSTSTEFSDSKYLLQFMERGNKCFWFILAGKRKYCVPIIWQGI